MPEKLTLKDYFAGQALQALLMQDENRRDPSPQKYEKLSQLAYSVAEAMIKARPRD